MNRRGFFRRVSLSSLLPLPWGGGVAAASGEGPPGGSFHSQAFAALPVEESYAFHKALSEGEWQTRRDPAAKPLSTEMAITDGGWTLLLKSGAGEPLRMAAADLRAYLELAMNTRVSVQTTVDLTGWAGRENVIVAAARQDLPGYGTDLSASKDYQIRVNSGQVVICGYDELGAMYGLYNLEERLDLRQGPFLPRDLNTTRRSLYKARMTMSGLGWMEWPDKYLAWLPRYGFDSIFTSMCSNPNGAVTPSYLDRVPWGCSFRFHTQDPAQLRDTIRRAGRYGISIYCPIMFRYTGEPDNEKELRKLVVDIVTQFPEIRGYVLLTEGFFYRTWFGAGGHGDSDLREWIRHWARGVGIVAEECHKLNPAIEILPWDYNIDFRPNQVELKKYVIDQLPKGTIPLVTFENGKAIAFDGESGYVHDYSISVVGPSEVAAAQITQAHKRGMGTVYTNADTWSCQQFGTLPHLPFPYQWYERYRALEESGVDGTLESWTPGFKPNFVAELRAWYSWTEAPPLDHILRQIAHRDFGAGSEDLVLDAWKRFSSAVRMNPNTGPSACGYNAVANPLFFKQPAEHIHTMGHSFCDQQKWMEATNTNPYWPYVVRSFLFYPDFTNRTNKAEEYARPFSLKVFKKYLLAAADEMERGLESYRRAALNAPPSKRANAFREVLLAEQIERTMRSSEAILEFEDLRFRLENTRDKAVCLDLLQRMTEIVESEVARTEASLETARRDSRVGYEWENDYIYWPQVLEKKLNLLRLALNEQLPAYRRQYS
ncbi:MAG: hypothetical protein HUU41_17405 [Bryobacteraceae bacterium]|nr:hypothetical protein [Bryobacterales bacterium]MEB2362082.1 hypothetical protein [Bryobacterales bacterium]NUN02890.1 hypothetical protein [Bryobacteraceae bacterium]